MTRTFKLSAIAAAAFIAAPAFAAASLDANLELDTKYGNSQNGAKRGISQGGRVEVNVAGKAGGDNGFVAGRGTLLIKKVNGAGDSGAAVDDMWGQIGTSMVDVKLGRFEAVEMYAVGKDVYVEDDNGQAHARTNKLRGRFGNSAAHLALTVNAAPGVSLELGVVESKTAGDVKGVRPVVSFAAGPVAVKLAVESGKVEGGDKFTGFGAVVGVPLLGGTLSANFSTRTDKPVTGDLKHTAFGLTGVFGAAGLVYINDKDETAAGTTFKQNTIYAAYSLPLFNTGATITPAFSYSKSKQDTTDGAASGVAVRINYTF